MGKIARNKAGDAMPVLQADTANRITIDASIAHAESDALKGGIYRLAVRFSTDDLGVMVQIEEEPLATTTDGMFMPQGSVEYVYIQEGHKISVIDGVLNVTPFN